MQKRIFEVLLCYGRLSLPALQRYAELSNRLAKHGLSVLIQQHLVLWYTSPDDRMTLYEANTAVAYSLVRSGKYIQIAEAQAGQFAGKVVSNLLLLGHARVGDLVQAYGIGLPNGVHAHPAAIHGKPSEIFSTSFSRTVDRIEGKDTTLESIHGTLYDLLQAELVSRVHISHYRSDADNRSEAEKLVPPPGEYKAKSIRERNAQHEVAVKRKLKEWKYCVGDEEDFEDFMKGKKRLHQGPENRWPDKRQRIDSPLSHDVSGITEDAYQPMSGENSYLDVCKLKICQARPGQLTLSRATSSFESIMPSLPS